MASETFSVSSLKTRMASSPQAVAIRPVKNMFFGIFQTLVDLSGGF
jgi:hypothetical protein